MFLGRPLGGGPLLGPVAAVFYHFAHSLSKADKSPSEVRAQGALFSFFRSRDCGRPRNSAPRGGPFTRAAIGGSKGGHHERAKGQSAPALVREKTPAPNTSDHQFAGRR